MGYNDPNRGTADWWKDTHNHPGHDGGPSTGPYAGSSYDANSYAPPTYGSSANTANNNTSGGYTNNATTYSASSSSSSKDDGMDDGVATVLLLLGLFGLYKLYVLLCSWATLQTPYREVTAFYYYALVFPIQKFIGVFELLGSVNSFTYNFFVTDGLTPYEALNRSLSLACLVIFYLVLLILCYSCVEQAVNFYKKSATCRHTLKISGVSLLCIFPLPGLFLLLRAIWLASGK